MLKIDRALQEVWDWKDDIYKESKDKSAHGIARTIRKEVEILKKSGLRKSIKRTRKEIKEGKVYSMKEVFGKGVIHARI